MNVKSTVSATVATLFVAASAVAGLWTEPKLLDTQEDTLVARGIKTIDVRAEAGSLVITGTSGSREVLLKAEFKGKDEDVLDELKLSHHREGSSLIITTETNDSGLIDLQLDVPATVVLRVDDGSGSLKVSDMARSVSIQDGSGAADISAISGDVEIQDGSGALTVRDLGGDLVIHDGSGAVDVARVKGSVEVRDGSGAISVIEVGRDVTVSDGSGSIEVTDVGGDFKLLSDGSGQVSEARIAGRRSSY